MPKMVVFGDGRTTYLDTYVAARNNTDMLIEINDQPGAGVRACTSAAYQHAYAYPYDICLIMAGAQDFIRFDNYVDRYIFPYDSLEFFTGYMNSLYQEGELAFHRAHSDGLIAFATLSGMDLHRYPWTNDASFDHQRILNTGVPIANSYITVINARNHLPTCWTARKIHRTRNNTFAHYYNFLSDGFHPTDALLDFWAEQIVTLAWRCT